MLATVLHPALDVSRIGTTWTTFAGASRDDVLEWACLLCACCLVKPTTFLFLQPTRPLSGYQSAKLRIHGFVAAKYVHVFLETLWQTIQHCGSNVPIMYALVLLVG